MRHADFTLDSFLYTEASMPSITRLSTLLFRYCASPPNTLIGGKLKAPPWRNFWLGQTFPLGWQVTNSFITVKVTLLSRSLAAGFLAVKEVLVGWKKGDEEFNWLREDWSRLDLGLGLWWLVVVRHSSTRKGLGWNAKF